MKLPLETEKRNLVFPDLGLGEASRGREGAAGSGALHAADTVHPNYTRDATIKTVPARIYLERFRETRISRCISLANRFLKRKAGCLSVNCFCRAALTMDFQFVRADRIRGGSGSWTK